MTAAVSERWTSKLTVRARGARHTILLRGTDVTVRHRPQAAPVVTGRLWADGTARLWVDTTPRVWAEAAAAVGAVLYSDDTPVLYTDDTPVEYA